MTITDPLEAIDELMGSIEDSIVNDDIESDLEIMEKILDDTTLPAAEISLRRAVLDYARSVTQEQQQQKEKPTDTIQD